jgi:hypothetical protein|tara:strand:- start:4678 stop:5319 length:642 start_codon:yes stop_codon:yes gene_type:complete
LLQQVKYNEPLLSIDLGLKNQPSFIGAYYLPEIDVCDELIVLHETSQQHEGVVSTPKDGIIIDKQQKDSMDADTDGLNPVIQKYMENLQVCVDAYKADYFYANATAAWCYETVLLQKYPLGGGFHKWHCERNSLSKAGRHLVFMTYLNDIDDGGETEFFYQQTKVKPKKGLSLIWPVDWTHTHRGIPSNTQIKYIATGWFKFIDTPETEGASA